MSVINQMLRDLDTRAASDQERAGLPPRIRTLPPGGQVRRQNLRMLAIGMGAGALLMAIVLLLFRVPSTPSEMPVVAPAPAVPSAVPPAPTSAVPVAPVAPADVAEMKLSMLVGQQAQPKPAVTPPPVSSPVSSSPTPPKTPTADKPVAALPATVPKSVPAPMPAPQAMAEEAQIDKRTKGGQGRELAEAEYRKAMQAVKRGDNEAALPLFKHSLELDPELARARQGYLSVLVAAKRWDVARQVAEQGLALDPTQSSWANIVARLQFEQGDAAGAVQTLERFAVHASHDADYQGLFAYLLQKQQRPAEAAERFRGALQVRPNEGRWWFGLALSLEQAGNAAGAKEAYAKAKAVGNLPPDMASTVEQKLK
jgi:Flp pilus assembly protein TadD